MGITTDSLDLSDDYSQNVSSLSGDTQGSHFYSKRVQPIASEAIAAKRVVYLELYHILNTIINTRSNSILKPLVKHALKLKYDALSDYSRFQLIQDIIFYVEYLMGQSKYTLDNFQCKLVIKSLIECISNIKDTLAVRQRTVSSNVEGISDAALDWINLRAAIYTTIEAISNVDPVDTMLLREGKLIIRVLTSYLDNLSKKFGRIVIKEDPFI